MFSPLSFFGLIKNDCILYNNSPLKKDCCLGRDFDAMLFLPLLVVTLSAVIAKPIQEIPGDSSIPVIAENPANHLQPSSDIGVLKKPASDGQEIARDLSIPIIAANSANKLKPLTKTDILKRPAGDGEEMAVDTGVSVDAGNIANNPGSTDTIISGRSDCGRQDTSLDKANSIPSSQINISTNAKGMGPVKSPP